MNDHKICEQLQGLREDMQHMHEVLAEILYRLTEDYAQAQAEEIAEQLANSNSVNDNPVLSKRAGGPVGKVGKR